MKEDISLKVVQQKVEQAVEQTNKKIEELGYNARELYDLLNEIQLKFDNIRNTPEENKIKYEELKKIRFNWKRQAEYIEIDYKNKKVEMAGKGAVGAGAGVAVVTLGPTFAMGIATTFGVASTGTAISTLSGVAATNAALAWLGGGALVAGGGGMAAGKALLALAGPVGWTIAGIAVVVSGLMYLNIKSENERLENIFVNIAKRDIKYFELAIVELNERIKRMKDESKKIANAIKKIETFGTDYDQMSEEQIEKLGAYVNLMNSSTMLIVNPIEGLKAKYTEKDFDLLYASERDFHKVKYVNRRDLIIAMCNLLYKIKLDEDDKKLLVKKLDNNKEFWNTFGMYKRKFDMEDLELIERALNYRYSYTNY